MTSEFNKKSRLVSVCICTFRRYEGIQKALNSILLQAIPGGWSLEIIVVDNDADSTVGTLVHELFKQSGTHLLRAVYVKEPISGVTFARNRCLSEAQGELIGFIDDDEEAKPLWLSGMIEQLQAGNADAVFGPVCPIYMEKPETWLIECGVHERPRFLSGTQIHWGDARAGNVLFSSALLNRVNQFDARFSRTGGEDSYFFAQAELQGAKFVWCNEAEVIEYVPSSRMTKLWVVQRAFFGGRTYSYQNKILYGTKHFIAVLFKGLLGTILYFPLTVVFWVFGKSKYMYYLRKAFGGLGKLAFWYRGGTYATTIK